MALPPLDAIESVATQMGGFFEAKVAQAIAKYKEEADPGSVISKDALKSTTVGEMYQPKRIDLGIAG